MDNIDELIEKYDSDPKPKATSNNPLHNNLLRFLFIFSITCIFLGFGGVTYCACTTPDILYTITITENGIDKSYQTHHYSISAGQFGGGQKEISFVDMETNELISTTNPYLIKRQL